MTIPAEPTTASLASVESQKGPIDFPFCYYVTRLRYLNEMRCMEVITRQGGNRQDIRDPHNILTSFSLPSFFLCPLLEHCLLI
jgi:hypothetical protein